MNSNKAPEKALSRMVRDGLGKREDLNCAETMLHAGNRVYGLKLEKPAIKLAAAFGGGMGVEETCGALTGGIMILSTLFVRDRGHESEYLKEMNREFFEKFKEKMECYGCTRLKELHRTEAEGCLHVVAAGAEILEEIISREWENRV